MARTPEQNNAIITGSIPRQLLLFFFPIWLGTMFQQLYNTVDTLIVGNFVGTQALAAVGATSSFVQLLVGLFVGLCSGAGVIIAQSFGAGDHDEVNRQVHTALALAIAGGAALTVIGLLISRPVLRLMQTPDEIVGMASEYLQIYFLGMIPQMIYNMGTNILRAVGDSKRPLYFLIVASIVNIVLDIVLVAVIPLGVAGAAIATVASQVVSAVLTVRCIHGSQGMPWHLQLKNIRIERSVLLAICRIGLPGAAQSALYSISNMTIQSAINGFGTVAVAAWSVYGKIDFLFWMTVSSFGIAVTTFAGQNFGARQYDRVRRGTMTCLAMTAGTTLCISLALYPSAQLLFRLFSSDDAVVAQRCEALGRIVRGDNCIMVASARALLRCVPPVESRYWESTTFAVGEEIPFDEVPQRLVGMGYTNAGAADAPGQVKNIGFFRAQGCKIIALNAAGAIALADIVDP